MIKTIEGQPKIKGRKFYVIASRFNEFITQRLLEACLVELKRRGVKDSEITVAWVPGAFEIPLAALKVAQKKTTAAVICLGAVIRGETLHFELIAANTAEGIARAVLQAEKPIVFGVLTTDTVDQAYKRSEAKGDNKGREAAVTAVKMANLLQQI